MREIYLLKVIQSQVDAFQGIPFAKPPVGKLRFEVAVVVV